MLEFLAEPRSLDEMAAHRFIYRPHVELSFVDTVERRSAELHVAADARRAARPPRSSRAASSGRAEP